MSYLYTGVLRSPRVARVPLVAGGGGSADDVVIFNGDAPAGRIINALLFVSGAVLTSTVQLRTATGGGGSTVFGALSSALTGLIPLPVATQATVALAAGGTLVARRSDSAIAGELVLWILPD